MNKTSFKIETARIKVEEYGYAGKTLKITVQYGFRKIQEQEPYFSITGTIDKLSGRDREILGGCIHEEIEKHFPYLASLIPWHLTSQSGLPMHYIANTLFQFKKGEYENAKESCVWGKVDTDNNKKMEEYTYTELKEYLADRLPTLQSAFNQEMDKHDIIRNNKERGK